MPLLTCANCSQVPVALFSSKDSTSSPSTYVVIAIVVDAAADVIESMSVVGNIGNSGESAEKHVSLAAMSWDELEGPPLATKPFQCTFMAKPRMGLGAKR